jgi:hypothetical protein
VHNADPTYLGAFLLTYRSFSTPDELLELLTKRWKIPRSSPAYKDAAKIHFRYRTDSLRARWLRYEQTLTHAFKPVLSACGWC